MLRQVAVSARSLSTSSIRQQDLIQQAFLKKVKEYAQKGGDLASSNPNVKKALQDELNRLAQKFQLASSDVVAKIPTDFTAAKVESSVAAALDGQTLAKMTESVKSSKSSYLAEREAARKAEAARLAALNAAKQ